LCGAKPKEKCTLSTGKPSVKTHLDRNLAAAQTSAPESFGQAWLRSLKAATSLGMRILFHHP